MTTNARLPEYLNAHLGFPVQDLAGGDIDGDWCGLAGYAGVTALFIKGTGAGGQDPTLTFQQAQDNAGTGAKALDIPDLFRKQGIGSDNFGAAWTRELTGVTDNVWTAPFGASDMFVAVHFRADELDIANGFSFIRVQSTDPGATAQLGALIYLLDGARFGGAESFTDPKG